MRTRKTLSILLALAILLSCIGWTPTQAEEATKETGSGAVTENIQPQSPDEGSNILQYVDEEEFHSHDHVARLREEERHDTYVFLNRDGTKTVYYMGRDVKYTDRNGQIREKDTTLVRGQGGYGMRDNDVLLHLPDEAGSGIRLSHGERGVRLIPQGGSGSATLADNSITYQNYFGRGIHLRYTPMLSGVKEDIILTKYTGQNSFTFTLETGGLTLFASEGQYYLAESEGAEAAFYLGEIVVYDAMGKPDLGTMTVETVTAGQSYRLTVSADADFLTDPETRYPVTIDPTLTISDNIIGAGSIEDAPVFQNYPNRNFGTYVYNSMGYVDDTFGMAKTVVRLNGLLGNGYYCQIAIDQIESMTFHVKCAGTSYAMIDLFALTENSEWAEDTVTWNNLGPYTTTAYDSQSVGGNAWSSFDITELAKDWLRGTPNGQCGFVLISQSNTTRTSTISCETTNTDNRPYVEFTYKNAVTINPAETEIYVGETTTLTATTVPAGQAVTWTSNDTEIAEVDENGVVTGIAPGTTIITATVAEGVAPATCEVTVYAKSVTLTPTVTTVYKGETVTIDANTIPDGESLVWTSSNTSVATVAGGVVTTQGKGQTIIRAAINNEVYAECTVNVVEFALTQTSVDVDETQTVTLSVETLLSGYTVTWSTANSAVATVDSAGKVTGVKAGKTTITARVAENISATCTVYVTIADGMYYIQNAYSNYALRNADTEATSASTFTDTKNSSTTSANRAFQLWKITYVADGMYTIRPMSRLASCLTVSSGNVVVSDTTLSDAAAIATMGWTITYNASYGYAFQHRGLTYRTMRPETTSMLAGSNVTASALTSNSYSYWTMEKAYGVFLRDTETLRIKETAVVEWQEIYSLSQMKLRVEQVGTVDEYYWSSDNSDVVSVYPYTGEIYGYRNGPVTITLTATISEVQYTQDYVVKVKGPVTFYGVTDEGHDHSSAPNEVASYLRGHEWTDVVVKEGVFTVETCKGDLSETTIFAIRTHGGHYYKDDMLIATATAILLNDPNENIPFALLYSHQYEFINSDSDYIREDENYSNIDIVVFIGCETGFGGEYAKNLPSVMVAQGAKVAIGFKEKINCDEANDWMKKFYNALLEGTSVQLAAQIASEDATSGSGLELDDVVICGDESYRIN